MVFFNTQTNILMFIINILEIAASLRFCEELSTSENLTFVFLLAFSQKFERSADKIYFADIGNEESLSRKYREDLAEQLIGVYDNMVEALQKNKIESKLLNRSLAWLFYRNAYSMANDISKSNLFFP